MFLCKRSFFSIYFVYVEAQSYYWVKLAHYGHNWWFFFRKFTRPLFDWYVKLISINMELRILFTLKKINFCKQFWGSKINSTSLWMKKTLQFYDNIKQKHPLWGIWDQLEIDTENNLNSLSVLDFLKSQFGRLLQTQKKIDFRTNLIFCRVQTWFNACVACKNQFRNRIDFFIFYFIFRN